MPTFTYTGGAASARGAVGTGGFNMGLWSPAFLLTLLSDANTTVSGNATQVTFSNSAMFGGTNTLVAQGTFSNYNASGPQAGTVTSFQYTTYFSTGVPVVMSATGVSISVASLNSWAISGNNAALEAALFGGNDTVTGTAFGDTLFGHGGLDTIDGGDGADSLIGGAGNDTINGGAGNDQIELDVGNDTLNGGDGDDSFVNNGGLSNTGVDIIDGGAGSDSVYLVLTSGNVSFSTAGLNTSTGITLSTGTVIRNVEVVALQTGSGNDTLTLTDGAYASQFYGGGGTDTLVADYSTSTEDWNLVPSSSSLIGRFNGCSLDSVERYVISTGSGADTLRGGTGNDIFNAGAGNDWLEGGLGTNILNAGDGNDTISAQIGVNTIDGGAGVDLVLLYGLDNSTVNWNALLSSGYAGNTFQNVERFSFAMGMNSTVNITGALTAGGWLYCGPTNTLVANFTGSSDAVVTDFYDWTQGSHTLQIHDLASMTFTGGSGNDVVYGRSGADNINGGAGNDRLNGYTGNDTINGGVGVDCALYEGFSSDSVTWTRNADGSWTVNGGGYGVDTLTSIEFLDLTDRDVVLDNAQRTFSGNGTSDLLFRNAAHGTVVIWDVTGGVQNSATVAGGAPGEWTIIGTGDLNGDGKDDLIWRHDAGGVAGWLMNGATATSIAMVGGAPNEWQVAGLGDFNFDGKDDFVWHNSETGAIAVWLMDGLTSTSQGIISGAPLEWSVAAIADFDGDGRDDILLRNDDGTLARWTTDGVTQTSASIVGGAPAEWQVAGTGDFDGDGRADILLHNSSSGAIALWRMNGSTQLGADIIGAAPTAWHVAQIGDFSGDGKDDIMLRNDDGTLALWTMNGAIVTNVSIFGGVPTEWGLI